MKCAFQRNLYDPLLTFHGSFFGILGKALGTEINGVINSNEDQDLIRDKVMLRKSYYQLVTAMLNNNLGDLFLLEDVFKFFLKDILHVINRESDPLVLAIIIILFETILSISEFILMRCFTSSSSKKVFSLYYGKQWNFGTMRITMK